MLDRLQPAASETRSVRAREMRGKTIPVFGQLQWGHLSSGGATCRGCHGVLLFASMDCWLSASFLVDWRNPVHQVIPVGRGISCRKALLEYPVSVGLAPVGPFGAFVVHPAIDDDLGLRVVAEEETELLQELRPLPGAVFRPDRVAESEHRGGRIRRYDFLGKLLDGRQDFRGCLIPVGLGMRLSELLDGRGKIFIRLLES